MISWSPLGGGWLSGRWRKDADVPTPMSPARQRLVERFDMSLEVDQSVPSRRSEFSTS